MLLVYVKTSKVTENLSHIKYNNSLVKAKKETILKPIDVINVTVIKNPV